VCSRQSHLESDPSLDKQSRSSIPVLPEFSDNYAITTVKKIKLGVLPDFREEGWPSMDLVAEELFVPDLPGVELIRVETPYRTLLGDPGKITNRLWNRFVRYPRALIPLRAEYDFFHICDHSYAHLGLYLNRKKYGVYCHDLDAFTRNLLAWKPFAYSLARGLAGASIVFCSTEVTRRALIQKGLVQANRLRVVPYGVSAEYTLDQSADTRSIVQPNYLLHVGSSIPRKRQDFLLELFAVLRKWDPSLHLIQVGGRWTQEHLAIIQKYQLSGFVSQIRNITRTELADYYRHAKLLLMTSEAEGFGLSIIEGLACGVRVLASNLNVVAEIGGNAIELAQPLDLADWLVKAKRILVNQDDPMDLKARLTWVKRYTWQAYAKEIVSAYLELAEKEIR